MNHHLRLGLATVIVAMSGVFLVAATAGLVLPFLLVLGTIAGAIWACER
jgi:hypothetical protein